MRAEVKEYFDTLEPFLQAMKPDEQSSEAMIDFTEFGKVSVEVLTRLVNLLNGSHSLTMHEALNAVCDIFADRKIICLLQTPIYSSFKITVSRQTAFINIVTENCGRYDYAVNIQGLAQRMYLCNLLGAISVKVPVRSFLHKDFVFEFDGENFHLNAIDNTPATV